jgi:hypothetical protein
MYAANRRIQTTKVTPSSSRTPLQTARLIRSIARRSCRWCFDPATVSCTNRHTRVGLTRVTDETDARTPTGRHRMRRAVPSMTVEGSLARWGPILRIQAARVQAATPLHHRLHHSRGSRPRTWCSRVKPQSYPNDRLLAVPARLHHESDPQPTEPCDARRRSSCSND